MRKKIIKNPVLIKGSKQELLKFTLFWLLSILPLLFLLFLCLCHLVLILQKGTFAFASSDGPAGCFLAV